MFFGLTASPHRIHPFKMHFNIISDMYVTMLIFLFYWKLCYWLRAKVRFVEFCFSRVLKSMYFILALDANSYLSCANVCSVTVLT